jgi:creatinine amidohydrolase
MPLERPRSVLWEDLRRPEFDALDRERSVVILPVASLEQHGPHLPVSTDVAIARAVAVRAAEGARDGPVLVLPVVWFGVTPFHMLYQGTVSLSATTLIHVVTDLCRSLQRQGFRRIILLNSHGGNIGTLEAAALRLLDLGLRVAAVTYWLLIPDEMKNFSEADRGAMGHAAHVETSLQLHLQPQHVDRTAMTGEHRGTTSVWGIPPELMHGIYMPPNFRRYTRSGVGGDHTQATDRVGQSIIEASGSALARFIEAYRTVPLEE